MFFSLILTKFYSLINHTKDEKKNTWKESFNFIRIVWLSTETVTGFFYSNALHLDEHCIEV